MTTTSTMRRTLILSCSLLLLSCGGGRPSSYDSVPAVELSNPPESPVAGQQVSVESQTRQQALASAREDMLDADPKLRSQALEELGELQDSGAVQDLSMALSDPDSLVRESAVQALSDIGGQEALLAIGMVLYDPDTMVREAAVDSLQLVNSATARSLLEVAADDPDPGVAASAREALSNQ